MSKKHKSFSYPEEFIKSWLLDNLGQPLISQSKPMEWRYNDPFESDKHHKLYVNVSTGKFMAFKSSKSGSFEYLVSLLNDRWSIKQARDHLFNCYVSKYGTESLENLVDSNSKVAESTVSNIVVRPTNSVSVSVLPEKSYHIDFKDRYSMPYVNYLRKRGLDDSFISRCFYSIADEYNGVKVNLSEYVIIPYYDRFGNIVYWTGRNINPFSNFRYFNSSNAGEFVYNIHTFDSVVAVCEGVFKAEKFGTAGIALGGKNFSDTQINQIVNNGFKKIILVPDFEKWEIKQGKSLAAGGPKKFAELMNELKNRRQNVHMLDWFKFFDKLNIREYVKGIDDIPVKGKIKVDMLSDCLIESSFEAEIVYKTGRVY